MFSTLSFVMISCLFADLVYKKGAAIWAWAKSEEATVAKKL